MLRRIALACSLALFVTIGSCKQTKEPPPRAAPPEIERIAVIGHGLAFDAKMKQIPIDLKTIRSMQDSLGKALAEARLADDADSKAFAARIEAAMAEAKSEEERTFLAGVLLHRKLQRADKKVRSTYDWRHRFLIERSRSLLDQRFRGQYQLSEAVRQLLQEAGLILVGLFDTDYMSECRAEQVPVPPNFSMAGSTGWVRQGALTYNILDPGDPADVWTWTDPARRGACVALPRDNGGPGTFAGIICQSATTGKACIWDNLSRADPSRRIPAATETMVIRELQDGRTLDVAAPCTECHTGNNVFLMSPDDATWAKLMRGPLDGPQPTPRTFTTIVEPQTDSPGGPRYTPIAHASWVNPPLAGGCAGACHGSPSTSVRNLYNGLTGTQRPPMPPACASGGYRNCYGTP